MLWGVTNSIVASAWRLAQDSHHACLWFQHTEQKLEQGAFPCAIGAEYGNELSLIHIQADIL